MKKFFSYFVVFFLISFAILNSRFVSAYINFWLSEDEIKAVAVEREKSLKVLPIAESVDFVLEIPSLGVKAPIILEKSLDPNKIFDRLENGVVHYSGSPLPGQKGAAIILGHSSAYPWYKGRFGSVFALLNRLENGDRIIINGGGKTLVYEVKESLIFNPLAKNTGLERLAATDDSSIILVSCWPVGTNYKRIAVRADLI